jgi:hypothetical protein
LEELVNHSKVSEFNDDSSQNYESACQYTRMLLLMSIEPWAATKKALQ